jgi:tight adherence protein B
MSQQLVFAALGSTVLFGVALAWLLYAEHRKASIEPRLKAIVTTRPSPDRVVVSLRRPLPPRRAMPAALLARFDEALAATGNRVRLRHLAAAAFLVGAAAGFGAEIVQSRPALSLAFAGVAALSAPVLVVQLAQSRHQRRFLDSFPDALDLIVRAVRAGLPVLEAIELGARELGAPVGVEFERVLGEIRIGVEMEDALQHAADRIRVPDFRFFVVSLLLHRQTGGSIAQTLAKLSAIIRQRRALRLKARALTAEATASTAVIATMPLVAGVGLFLINRELISVLFVDPRGRFMLGVAVVSLFLGIIIMKAIIRKNLH